MALNGIAYLDINTGFICRTCNRHVQIDANLHISSERCKKACYKIHSVPSKFHSDFDADSFDHQNYHRLDLPGVNS